MSPTGPRLGRGGDLVIQSQIDPTVIDKATLQDSLGLGGRHAQRELGYLLFLFVGACSPTPPPTPTVSYDLEVRSKGSLLFGTSVPNSGFPSIAWGPIALGPTPALPLFAANDLRVRLHVAGPNVSDLNPAQVAIYARDPQEFRSTLDTIVNDPAAWANETDRCALPDVVYLTATHDPFAPPNTVDAISTSSLVTSNFWSRCFPTPKGPGAVPLGQGSIKTLTTYRVGACRVRVPLSDIVEPVLDGIDGVLSGTIQDQGMGCADLTRYAEAVTYTADQSVNRIPDPLPSGGFSVLYGADVHIFVPKPDVHLDFNARFEFLLQGGRLTVAPSTNSLNVTGDNAAALQATLADGINNGIPTALYNRVDEKLGVSPGVPNSSAQGCASDADCGGTLICSSATKDGPKQCLLPAFGLCDPETGPDGLPTNAVTVEGGNCTLAFSRASTLLTQGAGVLGLSANVGAMQGTAFARHVVGNQTVYDHWQCRRPTNGRADPTERNRCTYVLDVKRINVHPDTVDLVFFDDRNEFTNSNVAAYVALAAGNLQGELCQDPPDFDSPRSFVRSSRPQQRLITANYRDVVSCLANNGGTVGGIIWPPIRGFLFPLAGLLPGLF